MVVVDLQVPSKVCQAVIGTDADNHAGVYG